MYILGDIGNTETKLCLVSKKNKIFFLVNLESNFLTKRQLIY